VWGQIKSWLPSITCFLPLLGPIAAIILLLIFQPCSLNLVVQFLSSRLEKFKLQMLMETKTTYYFSPLDGPLHGQPLCCGAPTHCPFSVGNSLE
jgi:hypothetical protein